MLHLISCYSESVIDHDLFSLSEPATTSTNYMLEKNEVFNIKCGQGTNDETCFNVDGALGDTNYDFTWLPSSNIGDLASFNIVPAVATISGVVTSPASLYAKTVKVEIQSGSLGPVWSTDDSVEV